MAKKLSLADKYALAKGNSAYTKKSTNLRSTGGSGSGINLSSRRRLPVQLKEQSTSRFSESFKRTSLPGSFGSPIKTLHSIPASADRPLSMYKVLPYLPQKKAFKDTNIANKVLKDRPWLQRNAVTVTKSNGRGMLGKLRSFLSSFKHQNNEFKRLSDSARKELNVRRQPEKKYVLHDDVFAPRTESHADNFDFDEVDANVQLAKKSLEQQRLLQKEAVLEKKIQDQSEEIQELKNEHEREVYLTKASYEAQLADLNVEIRQLHELNENRHQEIEKERLKEIENSVLKENESFLVFQRDTVQMLEDMKQRLEQKEKYLARKEERLRAMAKNIRTSHTSPEELLSTTTKSSNVQPISEGIGMNPPDSHDAAETPPNTSFADINIGHVNAMSALNKEHVKVVNEIKRTEEQFNRLLSSLTKKFETLAMKDKLTESERELNTRMEELPQLLEVTRKLESKPNNSYKKKLDSLFSFLEEFRVEYAKDKLKAYKLYESDQILETGHKVKQLTKSVRKKLAKREEIIRDIKLTINQLLIDQNSNDVAAIKASIRGLGDISNLLQQQDIAVSTLKQLATIKKKLDEIQLIMGDAE